MSEDAGEINPNPSPQTPDSTTKVDFDSYRVREGGQQADPAETQLQDLDEEVSFIRRPKVDPEAAKRSAKWQEEQSTKAEKKAKEDEEFAKTGKPNDANSFIERVGDAGGLGHVDPDVTKEFDESGGKTREGGVSGHGSFMKSEVEYKGSNGNESPSSNS